ncbi:hypothetical protein DRQ20_07210 [bacterium]|nr:MAG: hypothetical protein DRQ20_07210 [bacterium]
MTIAFYISTIVLLLVIILLLLRKERMRVEDVEPAISGAWTKLGLSEKLGTLATHVEEIKSLYQSLEKMFAVSQERGKFGEFTLEFILSDVLPGEMFRIRKEVPWGKKPDASIYTSEGILCIDSKFPLTKYMKMLEAEGMEREKLKKEFVNDVRKHLEKIAGDYVRPDQGSLPFAFAYIPSEGVFYFLLQEAHDVLRDYAKRGVQVVSPTTLLHNLQLIRAGVHAKKLSEKAEKVANSLRALARGMEQVEEVWRKFYTHFTNAYNQASNVNDAYQRLKDEFEKIRRME